MVVPIGKLCRIKNRAYTNKYMLLSILNQNEITFNGIRKDE